MENTRTSVVFVVALLLHCATLTALCKAQQCGSQANWALCGNNLCCSKWGWCGSGDEYCGDGCQSGPCSGGGETAQCGSQANWALCDIDLCCSQWGYCGSGDEYCGDGCQSGPCTGGGGGGGGGDGDVAGIISESILDQFLSRRSSSDCPANSFYTRSAFLGAADAFSGFGTTGDDTIQKRELAAFFANIAHESGSGCYKEEIYKDVYCDDRLAPCAPGQMYFGRGPIQLSWNYNYLAAGIAIGFDGINNPGIVATDPKISFETAVWYWMTQQSPTCHAAMVRGLGFGATIKAINGGLECGPGGNQAQQQARITLFRSYCSILGVDPGNNLTC